MIKIRLARQGTGNNKFFRLVAIDSRAKRNGIALDIVGTWHPSKKLIEIDTKKVHSWVSKGAILTPAAEKLIKGHKS